MVGQSILTAWHVLRYLGIRWVISRSTYAVKARSGLLEHRLPLFGWEERPLTSYLTDDRLSDPRRYLAYRRNDSPRFFFRAEERAIFAPILKRWNAGAGDPLLLADEFRRGLCRYFGAAPVVVGFPPDWHWNPRTGQRVSSERHWSRIDDFSTGDIKLIWETSRFGFVYALARAYWRTGDDAWAEVFWQSVESWRTQNPPQRGPNWKCGQEITFRLMAWCFGLNAFLTSPATTAERLVALSQMIAVSGERIDANLSYALNQRNNHGISEAVGLWTIGLLFPELSRAAVWRTRGRKLLEAMAKALIAEDGSFTQHSMNYHRLMLHDYLWALRLGELNDEPFPAELVEKIGKVGAFLYRVQDEQTGEVPNYGLNDGSLILPLTNCASRDFRPTIQSAHYLWTGTRCYKDGNWDEELLWLFGRKALAAEVVAPPRDELDAAVGGYYTLRSANGLVFTRCAKLQSRPGQADMLHVDLWWRGQNLALDPGTYSYNDSASGDSLARTAYHNTVSVDDRDQMRRVGRFLWLPWVRGIARRRSRSQSGHLAYWEGEHDGYCRLRAPVRYRRGILRIGDECWLVADRLESNAGHRYSSHWLLPDVPYLWEEKLVRLLLHTPEGEFFIRAMTSVEAASASLVRADEGSRRGWRASAYHSLEPALSLELAVEANCVLFFSVFGAQPVGLALENGRRLHLDGETWRASVEISSTGGSGLVTAVSLVGSSDDRLAIP